MDATIGVVEAQVQVLRAVVDWEPQFQLVLDFQSAFLDAGSLLNVEGCSVDRAGLNLRGEVFLMAEVVFEDPRVERAEASPWLGNN